MNVGSVLEIYTTMFGWSVYNTMFDLFRSTGLLTVPFLFVLINNWKEPLRSQDDKAASTTSLVRMQFDTIAMLAVFAIAVLPSVGIILKDVTYKTACTDQTSENEDTHPVYEENSRSGADTDTTYDATLGHISNVKIPALWWLVTSVGTGVNHAISSSFMCFEDMKTLDMQLRNLNIADESIRKEYAAFANQCYLPAKSKFAQALRGSQYTKYVKEQLAAYKVEYTLDFKNAKAVNKNDPYTMGSYFYLRTPGFYKETSKATCGTETGGCSMTAKNPVVGWPLKQSRDQYSPSSLTSAKWGRPACDEWWNETTRLYNNKPLGLRSKMLSSIEAADGVYDLDQADYSSDGFITKWWNKMKNAYKGSVNGLSEKLMSETQFEDMVLSRYIDGDLPNFTPDKGGIISGNDFTNTAAPLGTSALEADRAMGVVAGGLGIGALIHPVTRKILMGAAGKGASDITASVASQMLNFYVAMAIAKEAAPMVQAIILMMIYMFLLVYMVMTNYEIDNIIQMIFIILGIQFFTTVWNLADYLDAQLFVSMYPDATMIGSVFTFGINRVLLDAVLTILYVVGPMLMMWIMSMAGSQVSGFANASGSLGKPGGSPGKGAIGDSAGKGIKGLTGPKKEPEKEKK